MTPEQRQNLQRLLQPRHVAVIGGRDAATAVSECTRIGYSGAIWPVNPKRETLGGYPCFESVRDLPEAPDAVFLAIPVAAALEVITELRDLGAGGVVCYTAGFAEAGEDGRAAQDALVEAAGDMALIGPNCYGMINYLDQVALWPFAHGGSCPGYGAAIITQSGMISSDMTMSQRSVPFTHMISAGNQAVLQLEDFVDVLCEQAEVRAIGLHIEGLADIRRFSDAALKALRFGKPLVALKTGSSEVGARLTVSHTGCLSGSDDLYQALFDRLGIIRVDNPAQMLETLKFLSVSGVPNGNRVLGITCSGGGATMLADYGETIGLCFPQPEKETAQILEQELPDIATVSNPLDYTTPIWGVPERVLPVFRTACRDDYDTAVMVQDFPLPGLDESKSLYLNDTRSFMAAVKDAGLPAAVCSSLPENIDSETRDYLVGEGIAPLQGITEALNAVAAASWYGARRSQILSREPASLMAARRSGGLTLLDEQAGKELLKDAGVVIPEGRCVGREGIREAADQLGYPLVLKMVSANLPHKSEAGAVRLNLRSGEDAVCAAEQMLLDVTRSAPTAVADRFLIERMVEGAAAELLVGIRCDPQFGLAMTLASGGVFVELVDDAQTLLLPASERDILDALCQLKVARLLGGFRGRPVVDIERVASELVKLGRFAQSQAGGLAELEINPLFILKDGVCAVDVLMHLWSEPE